MGTNNIRYRMPLIVLAALAMGGCTSTTSGVADPTTVPTRVATSIEPTSASPDDPLAGVDPCTLLPPAVISQNQLQSGNSGIGPGTRYCRWDTGASGVGYNIAINIYDHDGLDQLNTTDFTVTNYPIGTRQGRLSKDPAGHTCAVSIGVNDTSRVDVVGVDYGGQQDRACVIATTVAPSVARLLPGGGS